MDKEREGEPQYQEKYLGGEAAATEEEDIVARGIQAFRPPGKEEQKVTILSGPYDPGGQPALETANPFYLGLFGWNVTGGVSITKAVLEDPDKLQDYWKWPRASHLIQEAERAGLEFELPLGRWLGFGGETHYAEEGLDTLAATCSLATVTSKILLLSAVHIGSHFHPLHIARLGANFDHVGNGRWGVNIIAGWNRGEAEFFGLDFLDHDLRYEIADEFITLMKHSWSLRTPFEFEGRFFQSKHVLVTGPDPTRQPRPFLVNAGYSPAGIDFAAKNCDWFLCRSPSGDWNEVKDIAMRAKRLALERYNRRLKALTYVYAVMAKSDAVAEQKFERLASMIDTEAADNYIRSALDQPGESEGALFPDKTLNKKAATVREMIGEDSYRRMALGLGGMHLVGSYDTVAEKLHQLAEEYNLDGALFSFFDPLEGVHQLGDEIIPRLKKVGMRK